MSNLEHRLLALAPTAGGRGERSARALHGLLDALVTAADGVEACRDTLGVRNQRLLRLHRALCGTELEACARCPACAAQVEFDVPGEAVLALPAPAPDMTVAHRGALFRLPRVADLAVLEHDDQQFSLPQRLVRLCLVQGKPKIDAEFAEELGDEFERADPAANMSLAVKCSDCGADFSVAVDVAPLIADALARVADGLLRDIDMIASAYGWREEEILALPADRRRLYVGLIAARGTSARSRPQSVGLPA